MRNSCWAGSAEALAQKKDKISRIKSSITPVMWCYSAARLHSNIIPGLQAQTTALVGWESQKNAILDVDWSNLCHMTQTTNMADILDMHSPFRQNQMF